MIAPTCSPPVLFTRRSNCCLQKVLGFVTYPDDAYRHSRYPIASAPASFAQFEGMTANLAQPQLVCIATTSSADRNRGHTVGVQRP